MTNAGEDGFAGNAKPDCRTEAAALIDLHASTRAKSEARDCVRRRVESYQDGAAANMDTRILKLWPIRCRFSAVSPEAVLPA
jgi:hypothetical protein